MNIKIHEDVNSSNLHIIKSLCLPPCVLFCTQISVLVIVFRAVPEKHSTQGRHFDPYT